MNVPPNIRVLCDCGTELVPARVAFPKTRVLKGVCRDCIHDFGPPRREEPRVNNRPPLAPDKLATLHRLLTAVCEVYGNGQCIHAHLMESDRFDEFVEPRQVGHYMSIKIFGLSSRDTGNFWKKDHSTVSYSANKIAAALATDLPLAAKLDAVRLHYGWLEAHDDRPTLVHTYTADHSAVGVARFR